MLDVTAAVLFDELNMSAGENVFISHGTCYVCSACHTISTAALVEKNVGVKTGVKMLSLALSRIAWIFPVIRHFFPVFFSFFTFCSSRECVTPENQILLK